MEICSVVAGSGEDGDNYEDGDEYEDKGGKRQGSGKILK